MSRTKIGWKVFEGFLEEFYAELRLVIVEWDPVDELSENSVFLLLCELVSGEAKVSEAKEGLAKRDRTKRIARVFFMVSLPTQG
jgi:hypothetical protein